MALTKEEVQRVAMLARIALDDEQIESLQAELNFVFEHIDAISSLDLASVEPTIHSIPLVNSMREDVVCPSLPVEVALKNAPERQSDAFLVPRIVAPGGGA
jgi:aspartyl-tRNA(Asn)/glutamyl-tRNA(Gln) amidotransferase subunit C